MDNIREMPKRKRPELCKGPLRIVAYGGCQHRRVEVDSKLAEVVCVDCREKLNPIWVLTMLATEDSRLADRWQTMRAELETMSERKRTKCQHCGRMTAIPSRASYSVLDEARRRLEQIERDQ